MSAGYVYDRDALARAIIEKQFPERTSRESRVIAAWALARGLRFDHWAFSVRVGQGIAPDPNHLEGVQRSASWSGRKRIDILCWQGEQPFIGEVKYRVNHAALGQLQMYQHLYAEEHPDEPLARLFAIGCYSDDDTIRVLNAQGVDVFLYPEADSGGGAAGDSAAPNDN